MAMIKFQRIAAVVLLAMMFAASANAQWPDRFKIPAERDPRSLTPVEGRLDSKLMARTVPYRVLLPPSYETDKTRRYPVVYLLHGLTGNYRNWTDLTLLPVYARDFEFIIVTPEGGNGWYTDNATIPNDRYESYIVKELIPEVDAKYRTLAARESRAIAGLSMGGYGAIKFGLKYPEMFRIAGSFSGALAAASMSGRGPNDRVGRAIDQIFGAPGSESRKANDIFQMIRDLTPERVKVLPFIYLDCGTEDFLFRNNVEFAALLAEKKVVHEYRHLPGAHNWSFWNSQVQEFLRLAKRGLAAR